jgi:hypothetical protein
MRTIHVRSLPACHLGATAIVLAVACAGCNPSPFKLVPVSGSVSLDGQPLAGGIVNFQPIVAGPGATAGPGSTARIGTDGRYTLATIRGEAGAVVGKHRVKIYSYNAETAKQDANGGPREREKVPPKYNYKSDVTFDVPVEGTDKADFSLEAK